MTGASTADNFDAEVTAAFGRHLLVRTGTQELRARQGSYDIYRKK